MTRPLRLEFPGALYHITSRGDRQKAIYLDDHDREGWLSVLARVCRRFNFIVHAYCQMTNHYHVMLETVEGNLAQGMRQLNGIYSQDFNRRHHLVGHVFQGRYKAILVQKECYLLELARYIVLNPVRAGMVNRAEEWPWSSHAAFVATSGAPAWLETDWLLSQFGPSRIEAVKAYRKFIASGMDRRSPLKETQHQLVLGNDAFVAQHSQPLGQQELTAVCRDQRRLGARSLAQYSEEYSNRDEAMARAYRSTVFAMVEIAKHFNVSYQTVSRAVKKYENCPEVTEVFLQSDDTLRGS